MTSVLDVDASGHMMKLSQMNKLYSRFKFLDFKHGRILHSYFESYGEKYDPKSGKSELEIAQKSQGYQGKFTTFFVGLTIFEFKLLDTLIYLISWIIKALAIMQLKNARKNLVISKFSCYLIHFSQKFHLVAFNLVALEIIIYCYRTLF